MARTNIQDRTSEFQSILAQAARQAKLSQSRQSLLTNSEKQAANGSTKRSEFARTAASVAAGISATMSKLERLSQLARRKTLFDDRPVEISELTGVVKSDLARLNQDIQQLQSMTIKEHPKPGDQEGEHEKNLVFLLRAKLGQVTTSFKGTLEERTKNLAASRSRTENFLANVSGHSNPSSLHPSRTESPLYQPENRPYQTTQAAQSDILSLDPSGPSALARAGPASNQQLMLMEEGAQGNAYIQQRGEAIDTIERTMNELGGGIFQQLAEMVSIQGEQIQRIDADTDAVVDNVDGAQRELLKYWSRVSGNRMLVAKMFGVLMIFFLLWVLIAG